MERAKFWKLVNKVISKSDVLILVLDARWINETRNEEIENKVKGLGKPLIYVITKCDLVEKEKIPKDLRPVLMSVRKKYGLLKLKERMMIEAERMGKKTVIVGVLGYPNVGKSSLINMMKGKKSAPTSPLSGWTRGIQKLKMNERIMFLDTPGVIPYGEKDFLKHVMINVIDYSKVEEPDLLVIELMNKFPGRIEAYYGVDVLEDKEETIEKIAIKKKIVKKGNAPDIRRMSVSILKDWQSGKM